ncbi:preprotein translocase subunit SecE [bacterium]|nr:preprotein translocase subunit SecE [bacterium]MCK4326485.1 preprotein translocase subunit SecE [bacterium]MCK4437010.1 preprotein translocase subunit SecE [bacterium]
MFARIKRFLIEIKAELRKVSWTNRKELVASTSVVVVAVMLIAIFVFLVDTPLSRLISSMLKYGR